MLNKTIKKLFDEAYNKSKPFSHKLWHKNLEDVRKEAIKLLPDTHYFTSILNQLKDLQSLDFFNQLMYYVQFYSHNAAVDNLLKDKLALIDKSKALEEKNKLFCQDANNSLEDRWYLFSVSKSGVEKNCLFDWQNEHIENFFQEYTSRYEKIDVVAKINSLQSDIEKGYADEKWAKENIDIIKEKILSIWIKSYIFDW